MLRKDKIYFELCDLLREDFEEFKRLALETNFDLDAKDDFHSGYKVHSFLYHAIETNKPYEVILFILDRGVDVNYTNGCNYDTALHKSWRTSDLNIIKLLISAGADVNCLNRFNQTPIWKLVEIKQKEKVLLFLQAGADICGNGCNLDEFHHIKKLIVEVRELLGENAIFVPMGQNDAGEMVYRLADENGQPYQAKQKILKDLQYKNFNCSSSVNYLISHSLFKSESNGQVSSALETNKVCKYLDKNDIRNASEVSAVRNDKNEVINSSALKNAKAEADDKVKCVLENTFKI